MSLWPNCLLSPKFNDFVCLICFLILVVRHCSCKVNARQINCLDIHCVPTTFGRDVIRLFTFQAQIMLIQQGILKFCHQDLWRFQVCIRLLIRTLYAWTSVIDIDQWSIDVDRWKGWPLTPTFNLWFVTLILLPVLLTTDENEIVLLSHEVSDFSEIFGLDFGVESSDVVIRNHRLGLELVCLISNPRDIRLHQLEVVLLEHVLLDLSEEHVHHELAVGHLISQLKLCIHSLYLPLPEPLKVFLQVFDIVLFVTRRVRNDRVWRRCDGLRLISHIRIIILLFAFGTFTIMIGGTWSLALISRVVKIALELVDWVLVIVCVEALAPDRVLAWHVWSQGCHCLELVAGVKFDYLAVYILEVAFVAGVFVLAEYITYLKGLTLLLKRFLIQIFHVLLLNYIILPACIK